MKWRDVSKPREIRLAYTGGRCLRRPMSIFRTTIVSTAMTMNAAATAIGSRESQADLSSFCPPCASGSESVLRLSAAAVDEAMMVMLKANSRMNIRSIRWTRLARIMQYHSFRIFRYRLQSRCGQNNTTLSAIPDFACPPLAHRRLRLKSNVGMVRAFTRKSRSPTLRGSTPIERASRV